MSIKNSLKPALPFLIYSGLGLLFVLAIVLRISLYPIQTSDYNAFLSPWYNFIQAHNGFAALKYNFSNYNPPYLYLLTVATYLPISKLFAIKSISVLFDLVLGLFTYLILRLKFKYIYSALIGLLVVLFAPTIFINSSLWGQCDAIYTAFCLGSLYFLLKNRPAWACIFFALAFSFKLQAIFFLPVLLMLIITRKLALKYLLLIPLIFFLMLAPAFIAGRDAGSLLNVYVSQASSGGTGGGNQLNAGGQFNGGQFNRGNRGNHNTQSNPGNQGNTNTNNQSNTGNQGNNNTNNQSNTTNQGNNNTNGQSNPGSQGNNQSNTANQGNGPAGHGQFNPGNRGNSQFAGRSFGGRGGNASSSLTLNAPTIYQWFPATASTAWKWLGIILAALFVALIGLLLLLSKKPLTNALILKIALVFALAIPFLLPEMHERYFYLADVLSIISAFYFPRTFYIAIIMQLSSLLSYAPYLLGNQIISLSLVSIAVLAITLISFIDLFRTLFPPASNPTSLTPQTDPTSLEHPAYS